MKSVFIIPLMISVGQAAAQPPATSVWTGLQIPVDFNNKWQWHNDAGYRTSGLSLSSYQYLFRTGARFFLSKETSAAAGVAFFLTRAGTEKADAGFGGEFRVWQELNHNTSAGKRFILQNRVRAEERWFDAVYNRPAYYAFRFRYRISGTVKLSEKWSAQLADEYMQQAVDGKFSFNQNRVTGTVFCQLAPGLSMQYGYMWILRPAVPQHVVMLTFQKNISLNGNNSIK